MPRKKTHTYQNKTNDAKQDERKTHRNNAITSALHAITHQLKSNRDAEAASDKKKESREQWTVFWLFLAAAFSVSAFFVSAYQAWLSTSAIQDARENSAQQSEDTRRSLKLTEIAALAASDGAAAIENLVVAQSSAAEATKRAAEATLLTAQASRDTNRIAREVEEATRRPRITPVGAYLLQSFTLGQSVKYAVDFINGGREATKYDFTNGFRWLPRTAIASDLDVDDSRLREAGSCMHRQPALTPRKGVAFPGGLTFTISINTDRDSDITIPHVDPNVISGEVFAEMTGCFTYMDRLTKRVHHTAFCYFSIADSGGVNPRALNYCPSGNEYD